MFMVETEFRNFFRLFDSLFVCLFFTDLKLYDVIGTRTNVLVFVFVDMDRQDPDLYKYTIYRVIRPLI